MMKDKIRNKMKDKALLTKDKALFFDAGPIISLVMSRLAFILPKLREQFGGRFYITPTVKRELVDRPLKVKRFGFEALQVMKMIRENLLEIYEDVPQQKVKTLISLANGSFRIKNKTMDIIQSGEMETVSSALENNAAVVMDERTLRLFIENNKEMANLLSRRFERRVVADPIKMNQFSQKLQGITIIRSIELVGIAYKMGLLDFYVPPWKNGRATLLEVVLWTTKLNGCAVTEREINEIKSYLLK